METFVSKIAKIHGHVHFEIEKNSKKQLSDIISIKIMQLILNLTETLLILLDIGLDEKISLLGKKAEIWYKAYKLGKIPLIFYTFIL